MTEDNYALIDCGGGKRLERFGSHLIVRPAPQANFPPALPLSRWQEASARFNRKGNEGQWVFKDTLPERFPFEMDGLTMELRFSPNGQLGVYPEQRDNWNWIRKQMDRSKTLRVLNGFAYTGGATLAATLDGKGSEICHLDSSKSAVNWAKENLKQMNLEDRTVRFIVEDMATFMEREIRRENFYQGLILDPPAFGRAAGGKNWKIQRDFPLLIQKASKLLKKPAFVLLSCHDRNITKEDLQDYLTTLPGIKAEWVELLDLTIPSKEGNALPNGIAARWSRK